jgi:hypothetical protein
MAVQVAKYAFHRNPVEPGRGRGYIDTSPTASGLLKKATLTHRHN